MISIVQQTLEFYTKYFKAPSLNDIEIDDAQLIDRQWSLFVTLYKNGEIRGSAGNIKEIKKSLISELIENTIAAIEDKRFAPIAQNELKDIKIRIDEIISRRVLQNWEVLKLNPVNHGLLAIKRDYEKMAALMPNIDSSLMTGEDCLPILQEKLNEKEFKDENYIIYELQTQTHRNF